MSELLGSQELKPVSDCHLSPQYHLCEPNPDMLTSVIENERTRRLVLQQCEKIETELDDLIENHPVHDDDKDIALRIDYLEKLSLFLEEETQLIGKSIKALKERIETPEIYIAIGRLSDSEFNRACASLKQNPNRQIRKELAQKSQDCDNYLCSSMRLLGSLKVDDMNDKLSLNPPSYNTAASVRTASDSAPSKPPQSFWKRIRKCSARI
ncbi:hypothetical protein N7517_000134 [Penicillium concentricum]|uniref:Uncharacterized protein n=1 Tax=Penicillium concentricum TaxID=293559 RepID=A0A9W9VHC0_9EURO|nr:uncharacterized protein N7517_000134 [Penicillium concentricum]KAJ5382223.1 hypothetical protein N7517_000134 [Penicillium concentricum]